MSQLRLQCPNSRPIPKTHPINPDEDKSLIRYQPLPLPLRPDTLLTSEIPGHAVNFRVVLALAVVLHNHTALKEKIHATKELSVRAENRNLLMRRRNARSPHL